MPGKIQLYFSLKNKAYVLSSITTIGLYLCHSLVRFVRYCAMGRPAFSIQRAAGESVAAQCRIENKAHKSATQEKPHSSSCSRAHNNFALRDWGGPIKNGWYVLLLLLAACNSNTAKQEETTSANALPDTVVRLTDVQLKNAGVQLGKPAIQNIKATIRANGSVDVPPQSMISISFPLGGYLKSTSLLPGASVKRGEVIGIMEDQSYVQLQQDYLTAKARMEYLLADMERQKELSEAEATSRKSYQLVLSEYKTQQVLMKSLEEKLLIIGINPGKLSVNSISRDVAVHSPINGYVTKVNVNIGKYVNPADVLFELVNPDDIHAAITVFEKDINLFKKDMQGKVFLTDTPNEQYDVEVILVTRNVDDSRSGLVHCHFENPKHELLPGMFLTGVFELDNKPVTAVPEEAVVRYEGREYVFTSQDGKQFTMMPVQTGGRENGFVELLADNRHDWLNTSIAVKGAYSLLGSMKNKAEEE
ncbi:efflux RND transporter periplasmic adaptor subunit [Foetidibacter luteolus]|uniref:efflux RND transporter periplasmic adaptor subunit n=1 Tax=Foetidibacter luteolus TaxID=2608880 RepID=UPI001F3C6458|nr:efflux RND transporter periplasmic adaptor subunit [Foetidibacter luteolus]